ncbi:putative isomerase [Phycomyces blakesleeanus]|uniref:Isomerase n=1 Tax=Phycomyces blakesleeanus TaxID=4837 RepID=A0ABR3BBA5_PHYBL
MIRFARIVTPKTIFGIPVLLAYVSAVMRLEVGDIILTGTSKGVGLIQAGDVITVGLRVGSTKEVLADLIFDVADRHGSSFF